MSTRIKIEDVRKATGIYFGLNRTELLADCQEFRISHPRQMGMAVAYELTGRSLPQIARSFGGFDHTSVLHGIRATRERTAECPDKAQDYVALQELSSRLASIRSARERQLVQEAIAAGEIIPARPLLEAAE